MDNGGITANGQAKSILVDEKGRIIISTGGGQGSQVTADTQVKAGAGYLHSLTFAQTDAAPTAGTITVYDSLTETGTVLFQWTLTTTVFNPFTILIDLPFSTGLYIGFATTADVGVTPNYS